MKNNLTRTISFFLIVFAVLSFVGCQIKDGKNDDLSQINELREDYNLGTCKNLRGDVSVVLFFMDDFESKWTQKEADKFTEEEIIPGLNFLEKQAKKYGVKLNLSVVEVHQAIFYDDELITSVRDTGLATIDVLTQAAEEIGFASTEDMIEHFRSLHQTEEVVCFALFNKNGGSYAINPKKEAPFHVDEHCIVFAKDKNATEDYPAGAQASIVAQVVLHLFGAEDLSSVTSRAMLSLTYYRDDIMLEQKYSINDNTIEEATAFYIGWTNEVPEILHDERWY